MKKISYISIFLLLIVFVCFTFSSASVYAYWQYYGSTSQSVLLNILTVVVPWKGSEILPSEMEKGKDHVALIEAVLNGTYMSNGQVVQLGLNGGENSYLNDVIKDRKGIFWRDANQIGSMDLWQDDNISDYFSLNQATNNLEFILEFPDGSNDTYYLYTTSVELGERRSPNIPIGTYVYPVYRTILEKNDSTGKWEPLITEEGYAPSKYYNNPLLGLAIDPAFDTQKWTAGSLGTSSSNAIYVDTGHTLQVVAKNEQTPVYYTITKTSQTDVKITVNEADTATIKVYNSSMNLVSVSAGAQGGKTLTFRAARNTKYYIEVVGDTLSTITVE